MKVLLGVLLTLGVAVIAAAVCMGVFTHIDIGEHDQGLFTFVYRDVASTEMDQVGEITTSLNELLASRGVAHRKPLDVFFPDGRGEIGFAVQDTTPEQVEALTTTSKVRNIPIQRYMVAEFPWRNPMSFLVGYARVDPALAEYRAKHGYKKVEALALNNGSVIVYMQPAVPE